VAPRLKVFKDLSDSLGPILGRLLLLEDDVLHAEWIGSCLLKKKIEVHWATEASSARHFLDQSIIENEKFHGVLTDIIMKDGSRDGLDLVRQANRLDLPCVAFSAFPDLEMAREVIRLGAVDFLEKPFSLDHLMGVFEKAWNQPRYLTILLERFIEVNQFTDKEREVCRLLFKGLSNREIADLLKVTEKTVKFHITGIFEKSGVKSRSELISTVFPT
jgi:DNA-binding NarL/FixJ family response regulator